MNAVYVVMEHLPYQNGAPRIICVCETQETARVIKNSENASLCWVSKENFKI